MISSYLALVSHFLANDVPFFCSDCFIRVTWPRWQFISTVCCKDCLLSFTFLNLNLKTYECSLEVCCLCRTPTWLRHWTPGKCSIWCPWSCQRRPCLHYICGWCGFCNIKFNVSKKFSFAQLPSRPISQTHYSTARCSRQLAIVCRCFLVVVFVRCQEYYLRILVALSRIVTSAVSRSGLLQESRPKEMNYDEWVGVIKKEDCKLMSQSQEKPVKRK